MHQQVALLQGPDEFVNIGQNSALHSYIPFAAALTLISS